MFVISQRTLVELPLAKAPPVKLEVLFIWSPQDNVSRTNEVEVEDPSTPPPKVN